MPLRSQIQIAKDLQNISAKNRPSGYIADILSPTVLVQKDVGHYFRFDVDNFRLVDDRRAYGSPANRVDYSVSTASYNCEWHSLKRLVSDKEVQNSDAALRPFIDTTENLTDRILLRKELDVATLLITNTSYASYISLAAGGVWSSNTTTTNPITLFLTATAQIISQCGMAPNVGGCDFSVWAAFCDHISVLDRIKYTGKEVSEAIAAPMLGLDKIAVSKARYITAGEGIAFTTTAMTNPWSDVFVLAFVPPSPGLAKPALSYTFVQNDNNAPFSVKRWRDEELGGEFVEVSHTYDPVIISNMCGTAIINCL